MSTVEDQLQFFARQGYVVVPDALSPAEVHLLKATIDRDLVDNEALWRGVTAGRRQNLSILLAQPELDFTMRPPSVLPLMEAIIGPELCAEEHSVMIRAANPDGPTECGWHRDSGGGTEPPYYTRYLSVVFYLTDVDETTHTFSVIPASAQTADSRELEEYDISAAHHIEGKAGTAVLFNAYTFHAGNVRITTAERRTIHLYCGRASDEHVSNLTIFPPRLWEGKDEPTRRYYGRLNPISQLLLNRF